MSTGQRDEGFFSALFDLSFTSFITTKLIKVIYILAMVGIALSALAIIIGGLVDGGANAFFGLVGGILWFFLGIVYVRVLLEFVIVVFRIGEHTATMSHALGGGAAPSAPWSTPGPPPAEPYRAPESAPPSAFPSPFPSPSPSSDWEPPPAPTAGDEDATRRLPEDRDDERRGPGDVPPPPPI